MKARSPRLKLSKFLSDNLGRYKWVGNWPAVFVKLAWDEPAPLRNPVKQRVYSAEAQPDGSIKFHEEEIEVPADALPVWVENIYERLWEEILPLKQGMSWEYYCAAMAGYAWAACQHEGNGRLRACAVAFEADMAALSMSKGRTSGKAEAELGMVSMLKQVRDKLGRNVMEPGFAYGVECRQREKEWTPSTKTQTCQIYKALVKNWRHVQMLTRRRATIRELGEYVATCAVMGDGMTLAQRFNKRAFAAVTVAEELREARARNLAKLGLKFNKPISVQCCQGEQEGAWKAYFKLFEKICSSLNMPRRPRGRPRGNS